MGEDLTRVSMRRNVRDLGGETMSKVQRSESRTDKERETPPPRSVQSSHKAPKRRTVKEEVSRMDELTVLLMQAFFFIP